MISLLLAAGAAAEPSAKFLALEQDWATDKVGLFFQHKDFETAWSNIQRDVEPRPQKATDGEKDLGEGDGVAGPLRCEQRAGDVMVVPSSWGRAARHDEPTIGWVSEVAFDREHTDGFGEFYGTESWRGTEAEVVY